jgi:hypothetical protein
VVAHGLAGKDPLHVGLESMLRIAIWDKFQFSDFGKFTILKQHA